MSPVTVCHNGTTISVPQATLGVHLGHGDTQGPCAPVDNKMTICHIPPGNIDNPQTMIINVSAWPSHAAHG